MRYRIHIIMILDRLQFVIYILSIVNNTILYHNTLFEYCIDKYNWRRYYIIKIYIIYKHRLVAPLGTNMAIYIDEHTT